MWQTPGADSSGTNERPPTYDESTQPVAHRSRSSSPKASPPDDRSRLWQAQEPRQFRKRPQSDIQTFCGSNASTPQAISPYSPGPMSPDAQDRVFPIRSVVTVDPNPTPSTRSVRSDADGFFPPRSESSYTGPPPPPSSTRQQLERADTSGFEYGFGNRGAGGGRRVSYSVHDSSKAMQQMNSALADHASAKSDDNSAKDQVSVAPSLKSSKSAKEDETVGLVTARFKHIVTEDGHAVITGRDGETLQRCEDEPIHIPGAVQSFGLLIALQEYPDGKLLVRVVSENSQEIIGFKPKQLFALDSFTDILSDEQADNLLDHIDFIKDEEADPASNGPEVFTISIRHPQTKKQTRLWCGIHINERHSNLVICEFELEDDIKNPLVPPDEESSEPPVDSLHSNPTAEELAESTINVSRPLRVLRSARKRRGETAAMEVFNIMAQVQEQLSSAPNLEVFLKVLVGVVKELTGFHRVMVYQFDQQWNGRVVAELVDPRATKDLYKGLNFPASDIPKQARDLYKVNRVRLLYDRDQETSRLVCRTTEDLEAPLDMTYAYLRAMSPIHVKYLRNMAVRASMSISINAFDELWGLISCHSYGAKGMRVSFPIRKMCRLIGETASHNIERLSYASRLQARKLINTVPTETNPGGYIIASSDDLLKLFDADCGLVSIGDETKILGHLDSTQEALALLEYLRLRRLQSVTTSQDIRIDFPDLRYPPGFQVIAGLLLVPLSVGGNDFIVFFRKGQLKEVKWAGNPYSKYIREGTEGYLEPRKSFKTWTETVVGKCREWSEEQIETAAVLCLIYGKFIEVWRQKEAAIQNTQLTRLLLANSAHEVRTPLNAIINYLEIAMEGSLDTETRENLSKSHSASKSLIYVINDLLDLTKTEEGNQLVIRDTTFDLHTTIQEATDSFKEDASRKRIEYLVNKNPTTPQEVVGDQRRVRQAIFNVVANAIQNTTSGSVNVDAYQVASSEDHVEIEVVVADTGPGMSAEHLDALFVELEQVQTEDEDSEGNKSLGKKGSSKEKRSLGLGLAVVSRIIRNMNGQLRVKSEEGKGSRFVLQMGFDLPTQGGSQKSVASGAGPEIANTVSRTDGEFTLIPKSSQVFAREKAWTDVPRRKSQDSLNSAKSIRSGSSGKSDVDRLIDAIQEPHMVPRSPSNKAASRSGSLEGRSTVLPAGRPNLSRSQTEVTPAPQQSVDEVAPNSAHASPTPGQMYVTDQGRPLRPVRIPDEAEIETQMVGSPAKAKSRVSFNVPEPAQPSTPEPPPGDGRLKILVAEDDPINSKIIHKRLERLKYEVMLTVNGEACASAHADSPEHFDAVLMDIQMPIVDGITSTKMIRSTEKVHPGNHLSPRAAINGRIPIFAVSASLVEREKDMYVDSGFDGWILKPIDFKRLDILLHGIWDKKTRSTCLYQKGEWERGGWFHSTQASVGQADTKPDQTKDVETKSEVPQSVPPEEQTGGAKIDEEQARLASLKSDAVSDADAPKDIGDSGQLDKSTEHPGNAAV